MKAVIKPCDPLFTRLRAAISLDSLAFCSSANFSRLAIASSSAWLGPGGGAGAFGAENIPPIFTPFLLF
jgi:hypothetical protein